MTIVMHKVAAPKSSAKSPAKSPAEQHPDLLTVFEVGALFPRNARGQHPAHTTIRTWVTRGVVVHGRVLKLRSVRVGNSVMIPRDAIAEFHAACNAET